MTAFRMRYADVERVRESLSPRDYALIEQVRALRLMSGAQVQAVHFPPVEHASADAAGRACRRVLRRLTRDGLLVRLERRVGGIRGGSAGFVYAATPLAYRVLDGNGARKRFREPSATFLSHTLAVAQLAVDLIGRQATRTLEILRLEPEPRCWRSFTDASGRQIVRPDLFVALGAGNYEHHSFVEIDLGTETMLRRITKCKQYQALYQSGAAQAEDDLFPRVVWCFPTAALAEQFTRQVTRTKTLSVDLFVATTPDRLLGVLAGGTS